MNDKSHPGDWLWIIADDRMVAMTPEAYAEAVRLADCEAPDAWEELRARGGSRGQLIKCALDVLTHGGSVRMERREVATAPPMAWSVYAVTPPEARAEAVQHDSAKRARRKRRAATEPPSLVLVHGGATG